MASDSSPTDAGQREGERQQEPVSSRLGGIVVGWCGINFSFFFISFFISLSFLAQLLALGYSDQFRLTSVCLSVSLSET